MEIWKDIKGFEGSYQISSLGRVKSVERTRKGKNGSVVPVYEKILSLKTDRDGYKDVSLCSNNKPKSYKVHRLVAEAFIPNPDNKPCIDHIDTDKTNNTVALNEDGSVNYEKTNLRWCTHSENRLNPITQKKLSLPIIQIDKTGKPLKYYKSMKEAIRKTNIDSRKAVKNRRYTAGGYRWLSFEDYEKWY